MAAPALCLGVLDGSRTARHFQVFQVFQQDPALLLVVPWKALEGSGRLWRVLKGSEGYLSSLDITGCPCSEPGDVWTSGGCV